jgi:hypothetical protein
MFFRDHRIAFAIILGVNNYAFFLFVVRIYQNLGFGVRIYPDVKDSSMPGKPGVRPTAVITNADGGDAVGDE